MFSVITACFNSAGTIADTLASVAAQTGIDCEHIVVDGGSTDGTIELVTASIHPGGKLLRGPDRGIADAMNKGIEAARGTWLVFLHSDDVLLESDSLAKVAAQLPESADVCSFPLLFGSPSKSRLVLPRSTGFRLNFKGINHQGAFIRRSLFQSVGLYDLSFKVAMDYDFFLRAYRARARFERRAGPVATMMSDGGLSSMVDRRSLDRRFGEERRSHEMHATAALKPLYAAWWFAYPLYRRVRSLVGG